MASKKERSPAALCFLQKTVLEKEISDRLPQRFWNKVRLDGDCWLWTGCTTKGPRGYGGYGQFQVDGRARSAHRFAYEALCRPIPRGLCIDHLCRNRACVNPAHMEAVTIKENLLRGCGACAQNARRTHCKNGHPFSGSNLILRTGRRACQICSRKAWRDWHRTHKGTRPDLWRY